MQKILHNRILSIPLGGEMLATVEGSNAAASVSYIHTDHLTGSAVITNSSGAQLQLLDYHPWGTIRINNQSASFNEKRKFAGHEYDAETGLSYMLARYYSPALGRFLSEDPAFVQLSSRYLERLLADPQQWNSYAYGRDNPLMYRDPDGQFIETVVDVGLGLYDVSRMAYWGVQTVGTYGGIGLSKIAGIDHSYLTNEVNRYQSKLADASVDVGVDAAGTMMPFVPAFGLRAGIKAVDHATDAGRGIQTYLKHVDVKSFGRTVYSGGRDLGPILKRIENGSIQGKVYKNSETFFPKQPQGYYREYEVKTPNWSTPGKGPERIIQGRGGETYYSPDHFQSPPIKLSN